MIFYSIFWTVYVPIALLILWLIEDTLRQYLQSAKARVGSLDQTVATARRHRHR
jgi:3-deoxy-D-manno-octulosonic-acid transferase